MNEPIFTEDDLIIMFPNEIQRNIFISGINKLINIIVERSVNVPFVNLTETY